MQEHEDGGLAADGEAVRGGSAPQVPLSAMLSERERRQAAERELEALRARACAEPPSSAAPEDAFDALNARFHNSEHGARARHGAAAIDAVQAWTAQRMREDPEFARAVMAQADPYDFAVEVHAAEAARDGGTRTPEAELPRSLVSAPSAGGAAHTPVGPGQAFDALFRR